MNSLRILLLALMILASGCTKAMKDMDGRVLPAEGKTARLIEPTGVIATTEGAMRELKTPSPSMRGINWATMSRAQVDETFHAAENEIADHLIQTGAAFKIAEGSRVRIITYFSHEFTPPNDNGSFPCYVKIEILEGVEKGRTGYTTADGVK